MNIAICDDEAYVRGYLRSLILRQESVCTITEYASGKELLQAQEKGDGRTPDILFLDISLGDMSGMEVAKRLRQKRRSREEAVWGSLPLLIFVTGYPEYMQEAFAVHAFQYLVKPLQERDFKQVFAQAVREYRCLVSARQETSGHILVRNGTVTRSVPTDEIYYIESSNRKVILHMRDDTMECYGKIGEMERELQRDFYRIHKGYLVNMKYVEQYDRTQMRLKNQDCLLISKYKYQDFVKNYLEYLSEER